MKALNSAAQTARSLPEKRLALYGLAAGAVLATGASSAEANLVTLDLTGQPVANRTTPGNGDLYFDVNAASAAAAFSTSSFAGADFKLQHFGSPYAGIAGLNPGNSIQGFQIDFFKASRLTTSDFVNAQGNFAPSASVAPFNPSWGPNETGYLGLKFVIGADTHYGWANITANSDATLTLNALGYETTPDTAAHAEPPSGRQYRIRQHACAPGNRRRWADRVSCQSEPNRPNEADKL